MTWYPVLVKRFRSGVRAVVDVPPIAGTGDA